MTVNDPCVSISTGTLSPDLRVKYAQGMILGLGEFLQEQKYFLDKDYLHERASHGFGTLYGLRVTVEPVSGSESDFTVTVAPGVAIDQWGRKVVVRSAQCARLGAWLAAQEQAGPGTVAAHLGASGELTVYVVAGYDQCADDLIPVPGQPCSTAAQTKMASRWRDSWKIELRWGPPPMPAWDIDRRLARLLSLVKIVAGPAPSDEDKIVEAVRALPDDAGTEPEPVPYQLPAETAADALDRILTVWVTEVRPQLSPSLTEPSDTWDPAILLASITFVPGPVPAVPGADVPISSCEAPVDEGRPYLLHTRLIQEMRLPVQAAGGSNGCELATLTSKLDGSGRVVLTAWFHLEEPVALSGPIQVASRSGSSGGFTPSAPGGSGGGEPQFSRIWTLTAPSGFPAVDHDQVAVSFVPASVLVGNKDTTLASRVGQGLELIDTMPDGKVVVYGTVELPPAPVVVQPQIPPVLEFVTITPLVGLDRQLELELWFHPQPAWNPPQTRITGLKPDLLRVFEERTGQEIRPRGVSEVAVNVWRLVIDPPDKVIDAAYLRVQFPASKIVIKVGGQTDMILSSWMDKAKIAFLNWDPAGETITGYTRVAGVK